MCAGVRGPVMEAGLVQGGSHLWPELPGKAPATGDPGLEIRGLEKNDLICFY